MIYNIDQIDKIVEELYLLIPKYKIFAFSGDLGAGKTTIIKKLLKKCGIQDVIVSPTYLYVNHYTNFQQKNFYHFDLYRIKDLKSFQEFGFHEILNQENSWAFIEWPDIINNLIYKNCVFIYLEYLDIDQRKIKIITP
ncbi:MAG: tRNA (adenosine(37)-N6)-threonylcarbamoyltransferase complex ATPase subunit type 1 TsaE [Novosphingobium sp.]|nr:tRNA (adenosine(37)-N6)-threonylcarbamoyltransferase complex ATPase subunit type 1 TsaE [Novosphingobium sp.]